MARILFHNETIHDYLDTRLVFAERQGQPLPTAIMLSPAEWHEFYTLYEQNYHDCVAVTSLIKPDVATYKDVLVFQNPHSDGHPTQHYRSELRELQDYITQMDTPAGSDRTLIHPGGIYPPPVFLGANGLTSSLPF